MKLEENIILEQQVTQEKQEVEFIEGGDRYELLFGEEASREIEEFNTKISKMSRIPRPEGRSYNPVYNRIENDMFLLFPPMKIRPKEKKVEYVVVKESWWTKLLNWFKK